MNMPISDFCTVQIVDLPPGVKGLVSTGTDGWPTILINARLNRESQRIVLGHELDHILHGDADSDEDIRTVECRADGAASPKTRTTPPLR